MKTYQMAIGSIAKELLKNPFAAETRTDWSSVLTWLRRPSTLVAFVAVNLFIFANYMSHRNFVLRVYKAWENFDGVRCGTGMAYNQIAITQGALFTLIPLGILYLAFTGIASDNYLSRPRSLSIESLAQTLKPWLILSLLWVLWLVAINGVLYYLMAPDMDYMMGFFTDIYGFPFLFFFPILVACFVGGWFGLALPTWLFRNAERRTTKIIVGTVLSIGLIIACPQLLNQVIVHVDMSFERWREMIICYELSTLASLPYLLVMTLLLPLWIRFALRVALN